MKKQTKKIIRKFLKGYGILKVKKTVFVDYEIFSWIKETEDETNKMSHKEFCDEMIKFGLEAKKVGGVKNLVFRDVK